MRLTAQLDNLKSVLCLPYFFRDQFGNVLTDSALNQILPHLHGYLFAHDSESNQKLAENDLIEEVVLPDGTKHNCVKSFACEFSLKKEIFEDGTSYNCLVAHMRFEESCLSEDDKEALNTLTCYSTKKSQFMLKFIYCECQDNKHVEVKTLGLFNVEFEMSSLMERYRDWIDSYGTFENDMDANLTIDRENITDLLEKDKKHLEKIIDAKTRFSVKFKNESRDVFFKHAYQRFPFKEFWDVFGTKLMAFDSKLFSINTEGRLNLDTNAHKVYDAKNKLYLIGKVVGRAMMHYQSIGVGFSDTLSRYLLDRPVNHSYLEDLCNSDLKEKLLTLFNFLTNDGEGYSKLMYDNDFKKVLGHYRSLCQENNDIIEKMGSTKLTRDEVFELRGLLFKH